MEGKEHVPANELTPFVVLTFADLKKYRYFYWFAFPSFVANPAWNMSNTGFRDLSSICASEAVRPQAVHQ